MASKEGESTAGRLCVTDLSKEYPTPAEPLVVLRGVSLTMSAGDSAAIVGPSGSGKSTLLNILGTLDEPTGGTVRMGEVDPFALDDKKLAEYRGQFVGFVFQDHHLLPQCTAQENVQIAALALGRVDAGDVARSAELLERVGLADRAGHLPGELSGGERQRVAIARAMMNRPAMLLCDEPTGNLDAHTGEAVAELILSLTAQDEAILIVATHSAALAGRMACRKRLIEGTLVDGDD